MTSRTPWPGEVRRAGALHLDGEFDHAFGNRVGLVIDPVLHQVQVALILEDEFFFARAKA
jgi:hypothetical protein